MPIAVKTRIFLRQLIHGQCYAGWIIFNLQKIGWSVDVKIPMERIAGELRSPSENTHALRDSFKITLMRDDGAEITLSDKDYCFFFVGLAPLIVNRYMKYTSDKLRSPAAEQKQSSWVIISGELGLHAEYFKRLCEILGGAI